MDMWLENMTTKSIKQTNLWILRKIVWTPRQELYCGRICTLKEGDALSKFVTTVDCVHWQSNLIQGFMRLELCSGSTDHETSQNRRVLTWFPHSNKGFPSGVVYVTNYCFYSTVYDIFLRTAGKVSEEDIFVTRKWNKKESKEGRSPSPSFT